MTPRPAISVTIQITGTSSKPRSKSDVIFEKSKVLHTLHPQKRLLKTVGFQ